MKQIRDYKLLFDYDFLIPNAKYTKTGVDICFDFKVHKSKYLMIRGGDFYALYDHVD